MSPKSLHNSRKELHHSHMFFDKWKLENQCVSMHNFTFLNKEKF
jgi:hypothetical protein